MVKEVVRWETTDGMLFDTIAGAEKYEFRKNMVNFVYDSLDVCRNTSDAEEIVSFIEQHTKGWK